MRGKVGRGGWREEMGEDGGRLGGGTYHLGVLSQVNATEKSKGKARQGHRAVQPRWPLSMPRSSTP